MLEPEHQAEPRHKKTSGNSELVRHKPMLLLISRTVYNLIIMLSLGSIELGCVISETVLRCNEVTYYRHIAK